MTVSVRVLTSLPEAESLAQWAREKFEPHAEWYCAPTPFPLERHLRAKFEDPDYEIVVAEDAGQIIAYMIVVDPKEFCEWFVPDPDHALEAFTVLGEYGTQRWPKLWGFATPQYGMFMLNVPLSVEIEYDEATGVYRVAGTDKRGELMAEPIIDTG